MHNNKMPSFTKKGPGRYHAQGDGRIRTKLKAPRMHRERRMKEEKSVLHVVTLSRHAISISREPKKPSFFLTRLKGFFS